MRALAFAGVALTIALSAAPAGAKPVGRDATVIVNQLAFGTIPRNLHVGDTIVWVNRDLFRHSATSKGNFDINLPAGSTQRMKLTKAGDFPFTCKFHPGMTGVLKVSR